MFDKKWKCIVMVLGAQGRVIQIGLTDKDNKLFIFLVWMMHKVLFSILSKSKQTILDK